MAATSDEIELAWAAGFWDGEGSVTWKQFQFSITQKDRRPLERFAEAVFGDSCRILGPYACMGGMHTVSGSGAKTKTLFVKLWPYLSEPKREQALRAWAGFVESRKEGNSPLVAEGFVPGRVQLTRQTMG